MRIIGLAGPSSSGKTSVANELRQTLDAEVLSLDHFYKEGYPNIYVEKDGEKIRTYERPELYDGKKAAEVINDLKEGDVVVDIWDMDREEYRENVFEKKDYVIVEGFLLYTYEELRTVIDDMFYLDLDRDTIIERRLKRLDRTSDKTFLEIGIEEFERFGREQKFYDEVKVIDAKKEIKEIEKEVLSLLDE